jgi:5-methylcytosine-specific restriction protein A
VLAPTPCIEPNCQDKTVKNGKCQAHQTPWRGSTRSERLPGDWRTRRLIVLKRGGGICHICQQPGADTVDHVVAGDDHSLSNLAPVHDAVAPHCHRYKSSQEGNDAQKNNKIKKRH